VIAAQDPEICAIIEEAVEDINDMPGVVAQCQFLGLVMSRLATARIQVELFPVRGGVALERVVLH